MVPAAAAEPAWDLFVSYSHADAVAVRAIVHGLVARGLRVWMDTRDLAAAADWRLEVWDAIESSGAVLAMLSPGSVTSAECVEELQHAIQAGKRLLPVMLVDVPATVLLPELARLQWIRAGTASATVDAVHEVLLAAGGTRPAPADSYAWSRDALSDGLAEPRVARPVAPPVPSGFVGRGTAMHRASRALRGGRVVTITAPGGTGKTSLAIGVLHSVADDLPGGAVFVDLASVRSAAQVGTSVALAMRALTPGVSPWESIRAATTGRGTLVVLDNCEQVAGLAPELAAHVSELADVAWLATSRAPLGLAGEHLLPLPPLEVAVGAVKDECDLAASPAGALLLARAREARPELMVDDATAADLAEICRRLDGHPLAIELAAARLRFQSASTVRRAIAASIADLRDLDGRSDPRQRELSAVLEWSTGRLDRASRLVLSGLSAFEVATTTDAIAHVVEQEDRDVLAPLSRLLDAGLARAVDVGTGDPRFTLLVPVREHVRRGLEPQVLARLIHRHADYHLGWAHHGSVVLHNTTLAADNEWRDDAVARRSDALVALERLRVDDPARALTLTNDLAVLWHENREADRAVQIYADLLDRVDKDSIDGVVGRLIAVAADERLAGSVYDTKDLVSAASRLGSSELVAMGLVAGAYSRYRLGRYVEALRLADEGARAAEHAMAEVEATGGVPLNGYTRPGTARFLALALPAWLLRWRDAPAWLELSGRVFATCVEGTIEHEAWIRQLLLAQVECGRLVEARATLTEIERFGLPDTYGYLPSWAQLLSREGRHDLAAELCIRYRPQGSGVHARALEAAALAADCLMLCGRPDEAFAEVDWVSEHPPAIHRSLPAARRARLLVELGRRADAEEELERVRVELADEDEASPGVLTYLLTTAMLADDAGRAEALARYDKLVVATGVIPWPRDAADRAALAADPCALLG